MGCASIKWSVLRAYATLRNFVSPDLALRKCMSQEALGPPETRPSASQDLGEDSPVALGDGKSPLPPSLYEAFAESILALRPLHREAHH